MKMVTAIFLTLMAGAALAQSDAGPVTSPTVAAKLAQRGDTSKLYVPEIRATRKNDILVVQADLQNQDKADKTIYYRFQWLNGVGSQVGDGESWKQLQLLGMSVQTIKSVAPTSAVVDFRVELTVQ